MLLLFTIFFLLKLCTIRSLRSVCTHIHNKFHESLKGDTCVANFSSPYQALLTFQQMLKFALVKSDVMDLTLSSILLVNC